ncbi:MAG: phospholipid carrier-dependent glycosyltransferase [Candidatus Moraniibacteriota bacterium]
MEKYIVFGKKYWVVMALAVLIFLAFAIRFYHFDEWLYFKMDQSRDALLIGKAIEKGPGYLPLLGARAGATELAHGFLRLGPAYYYFQYLSGVIFDSIHPSVFAYPDLFFSVAVIPLLYAFLRLYFSKRNALLVTTMYAFSFLIIQYSRFAWNPNSLQFFIILAFYGLLRFLNEPRPTQKKWWLGLFVFGLTVGSQLHFFGFFSLLGISGLLILFHLRVWNWESLRALFRVTVLKQGASYIVVGLAVFLVLYSPVILSDRMEGWQNTKNFFEALGSKAQKKPFFEKVQKDVLENLNYYCLLTTSSCYNGNMKAHALPITASALVILSGFLLAIRRLRRETNPLSRDFLWLSILWFLVFSVLTLPVAFQLRPRFYIVVFAIPFIFLGFLFEFLEERFGKRAIFAIMIITLAVLAANMRGTYLWFREMSVAQQKITKTDRTLILKNQDGVTLGQLQRATDWMYARYESGKHLYYYVKPEHIRPVNFLLVEKKDTGLRFTTMKLNEDPDAQYFAITPAKNGIAPFTKKYQAQVEIVDSEQFGQLMVFELRIPNRVTTPSFKWKSGGGGEDRLYWKDVFGK